MLLDNAEEPSDIKNGVGTFTTFRVEYLINDILSKVKEAREEGYLDGQRGVGLMIKRELEKSVISNSIKLQMIQFDIEGLLKRLAEPKK
jgi:hypothetical protein